MEMHYVNMRGCKSADPLQRVIYRGYEGAAWLRLWGGIIHPGINNMNNSGGVGYYPGRIWASDTVWCVTSSEIK